jgi:hypothetical protein
VFVRGLVGVSGLIAGGGVGHWGMASETDDAGLRGARHASRPDSTDPSVASMGGGKDTAARPSCLTDENCGAPRLVPYREATA